MDWKLLLKELAGRSITQTHIAQVCGVAQSTVSDLARGASKQPSFEFGMKLIEMRDAANGQVAASSGGSAAQPQETHSAA